MRFRKKRNIFKTLIHSQIFLSILGLIIIFLISYPLAKKVSKQYKVNKEIEELKMEISEIESKNSNLNDLLTYLESDQFVEEQARERLNLKKEGEEVVVIKKPGEDNLSVNGQNIESPNVYNVPAQNNNSVYKKENNYQKWIKYFFK